MVQRVSVPLYQLFYTFLNIKQSEEKSKGCSSYQGLQNKYECVANSALHVWYLTQLPVKLSICPIVFIDPH